MPYSLFAGSLRCPVCGNVASDPTAIWIQTKLPRDEGSKAYGIGDSIEIVPPEAAGYLPVRPWKPAEPLHLLEAWACPHCGQEPNWAELVIDRGRVTSIAPTPLDASALARIHYLTPELDLYFDQLTGSPLFVNGARRKDFLDLLRQRLEGSR